jgi:hypothetical protein
MPKKYSPSTRAFILRKASTRPVAAVQLVGAVLLVIAAAARLLEQNKADPKHAKPDKDDTQ